MEPWIEEHAAGLAARAERDLEALVAVSSPSGDVRAPPRRPSPSPRRSRRTRRSVERVCRAPRPSTPPTSSLRVRGPGRAPRAARRAPRHGRRPRRPPCRRSATATALLRLGHDRHEGRRRALARRAARARRACRALAEAALLLVNDEEWRTAPFAHVARFAGLRRLPVLRGRRARPGRGRRGRRAPQGRGHASASRAHGRAAHSGSAPDKGVNALLALAAGRARRVAGCHDPAGPDRLTRGADDHAQRRRVQRRARQRRARLRRARRPPRGAATAVLDAIPDERRRRAHRARGCSASGPGMDAREAARRPLARAGAALGRPIVGAQRGGASDASHFAAAIPVTIDGLGAARRARPRPDEYVRSALAAAARGGRAGRRATPSCRRPPEGSITQEEIATLSREVL